ncbi:MAG: low specificity L-threonine aldolase [Verrucomicrobiota bacterium]|nr:low specificity L-threonine aldolase [Verrucomicrobiota bacterium]MDQ6939796.1 low specificity L-threonine aldolase [Verrucomicrobiota bacterium]
MIAPRFDLASDNTAGICPEAFRALEEANDAAVASYGDDDWSDRLCDGVRQIFETDCEIFLVFNGTAANSLALAHLCRPYHSVVCHELAHIETDECGAPEFLSGGAKLLLTSGANGKLDLVQVAAMLEKQHEIHSPRPRVISVTQATELGTVYTRDELAAIGEFARARSLYFHMDGARFANALVSLGCKPKEITAQVGVDVLCFGGIKNGVGIGELVLFFNEELAQDFDYRAKQAGQLASKMRFLAAPWLGLLRDDVWLQNARRANASAKSFAARLRSTVGWEPIFPQESNSLFYRMDGERVAQLESRGWQFYKFVEPDIYRLMCSWNTNEFIVDEFVKDAKEICSHT